MGFGICAHGCSKELSLLTGGKEQRDFDGQKKGEWRKGREKDAKRERVGEIT